MHQAYPTVDLDSKSSLTDIRERFDQDVERFSDLSRGQQTTLDAPHVLDLIQDCVTTLYPHARTCLDLGAGAGNYCLLLSTALPNLLCTLVDISEPMLLRAKLRLEQTSALQHTYLQQDIRDISTLPPNHYDIVISGATLHHLREDEEWVQQFRNIYRTLKPGGHLYVTDLIVHDDPGLNDVVWAKYGDYLTSLGGLSYREQVLKYISKEDSPRSLNYQFELLSTVGFEKIDILHKNLCFGTYLAIKPS